MSDLQAILDKWGLYRRESEDGRFIEFRVRGTNNLVAWIATKAIADRPHIELIILTMKDRNWSKHGLYAATTMTYGGTVAAG